MAVRQEQRRQVGEADRKKKSEIQRSGCKTTISSVIESNSEEGGMRKKKTKSAFMGMGCAGIGSSQKVSLPALIRSSADWDSHKKPRKTRPTHKDRNALLIDFHDLWCGPGIAFSADAADCVVASAPIVSRPKIDSVSAHRERSCMARRTVTPEPPPFFDTESEFLSDRPGPDMFGARYFRHVRHPSPEGLAEIMMLQSGLLIGGRVDIHDRFRDMRLDVDNMSYEELLDLGERIGYVNTGLKEDEIGRCIRKIKLSISNEWSRMSSQADRKCSICQEEYEANDDIGKLDCGHGFHIECIRHWLSHKNTCPVCKSEAVARPC